jgi:hypothetical protein
MKVTQPDQEQGQTKRDLAPKPKLSLLAALPIVLMVAITGGLIIWRSFAAVPTTFPSEFIARTYTEGLGRLPDQAGWSDWQKRFASTGCNAASLSQFVSGIYKGTEFQGLPYDNQERLLSLYRGVLSREPDSGGYAYWLAKLSSGTSYTTVIDSFMASTEFKNLATKVCGGLEANFALKGQPLAIKATMTQQQLQTMLDTAVPGSVITIPRGTLIKVEARLTVPKGVTLTTNGVSGSQGRQAYASMARIVYAPTSANITKASLVVVQEGATLKNVWVDGQMWNYPTKNGGPNVRFAPTSPGSSVIENIRSDNARSAQNITLTSNTGECINPITIQSNLVINSANLHTADKWADGIATVCARATIIYNEILDASDVAIIAYRTYGSVAQGSVIKWNNILQAGNDVFAGLAADPLSTTSTPRAYPDCLVKQGASVSNCDFTGLEMSDNTLWTSPDRRMIIGLSVGTRAWSFFQPDSARGSGGSFTNNSTGVGTMNAQLPIYVSGLSNSQVADNFGNNKTTGASGAKIVGGVSGTTGYLCQSNAIFTVSPDYISSGMTDYTIKNNDDCI